jgi:hypothetical protein
LPEADPGEAIHQHPPELRVLLCSFSAKSIKSRLEVGNSLIGVPFAHAHIG